MRRRKKITPRWMSITRKLYTYLGGTSLLTLFSAKFGFDETTKDIILQFYLMGLAVIQIVCDVSYEKEKPLDFPPDKSDKIR